MSDIFYILEWWFFLFILGLLFLPLSISLFSRFYGKGYIFAKVLGISFLTYILFIVGITRLLPFVRATIFIVLTIIAVIDFLVFRKNKFKITRKDFFLFVFQEILFVASLFFWSYIKSFQPDINGLEKFMDYGFINSILRSTYFPPTDIWFPPFSINYYYFGHLATAILIRLSSVPSYIAFNLMLSTIFAFTVTSAFSIVSTLSMQFFKSQKTSILSGILAGIITSLGGNLHTIYSFFKPYTPPENPVPFWHLPFLPGSFPNNYWYPNATRFIPFTIHEFPSYSFVVSDLHGHVLDIPFVFLTLALILKIFLDKKITYKMTILISFFLAFMYMTNAWDGIIYFMLFGMTALLWKSDILKFKKTKGKKKSFFSYFSNIINKTKYIKEVVKFVLLAGFGYFVFTLPFNFHFKPFVSGIGVLCAPKFLTNIGKLGPFLFEANHCQRTPFWMLVILYGFFYFFVTVFIIKILRLKKTPAIFIFLLMLSLISTILIATPEFIYAKDIYPAHYRANTMFKLGYQAFIMLMLVTSFSITYILHKGKRIIWVPVIFVFLSLILIYPYFSVQSYFGELKDQKGLNGINYLKTTHNDDYYAILWIEKNIKGQPVMLEAQGDSYTDYERISANTGLPTPLGWTVHEWLWRGDYSFPASRLSDITALYEGSLNQTETLIKKYNISYVYVGELEREKYPNLNEKKFEEIGKVIYQRNNTKIYKI